MALIKGFFNKISYQNLIIWMFLGFVALIPIQTRLVYFLPSSHLGQIYIFYNTLFLHLTDLAIALVTALWVLGLALEKFHVKQEPGRTGSIWMFGLFLAIAIVSAIVAYETIAILSIFGLFKLFLLITLLCFIINRIDVKQMFHKIFWVLVGSSVFESVIGIWQYFVQKSLGLKLFGEEYIRPYLSGVAKFKIPGGIRWTLDQLAGVSRETDFVARPYGTFPHPNVFGMFLMATSLLAIYLFFVSRETWKKYVLGSTIFIQIFTMAIVYSRVVVAAWAVAAAVWLTMFYMKQGGKGIGRTMEGIRSIKQILVILFFSGAVCVSLFYPLYLERTGIVSYGTTNAEAVSERILYQKIAWEMIKDRPLTGVGYQNFVSAMDEYSPQILKPWEHQPVHNIYLLAAAETGLFGLAAFLGFLGLLIWTAWRRGFNPISATLFSIFIGFIFIGFFDHYLLTIQQGRLMLFLIAGLLLASSDLAGPTLQSERFSNRPAGVKDPAAKYAGFEL